MGTLEAMTKWKCSANQRWAGIESIDDDYKHPKHLILGLVPWQPTI